ncbi:unnamed protein product [Blepharisma stoltei]|uniref:Uncharacterized protein n=1 Tax=Blepharisma stoltei TaxID=1481888 RepID=A0AAU9J1R4_9CILI|nr:unnamed protein product [Blepharisma stoltei]
MEDKKLAPAMSESSFTKKASQISVNNHLRNLEYSPMKRAHVTIPKISNGEELNIFNLFALHANYSNININIPATLIRVENSNYPYIVQTSKTGTVISRLCLDQDFFLLTPEKSAQDIPIYCYKLSNANTVFLYSKENAEGLWRLPSDSLGMMQQFVACQTKNASITRVYWKVGMKSQHFVMINRENPKCNSSIKLKKTQTPLLSKKKRSMTLVGDFKWSDLMSKTSKSINNPFTVNTLSKPFKKARQRYSSMIPIDGNDNKLLGIVESPQNYETFPSSESGVTPIVNTKIADSYFVIENNIRVIEIESMVQQIVSFLNGSIFKGVELKEIILDFIQDRKKRWVFLGCQEYSLFTKSPSDSLVKRRAELEPLTKRRTMSNGETQKLNNQEQGLNNMPTDDQRETADEDQPKATFSSLNSSPKIVHTSQNPIENEFFQKFNKVNQKLDQIIKLKPQNVRTMNLKEQSIKAYQNRFSISNVNGEASDTEGQLSERPATQCPYKSAGATSLWNDKSNEYINKCFLEIIGRIDEMNMNTELLRIKRQNLVRKYGGEEFWYQFINELYDKVMAYECLRRYFKSSNLVMIIGGMLKLFNGCATLEFRRKIKAAHEFLGISEKDFFLYTTLFEDTLRSFKIDAEDRQSIMTQIKSMKCLICRQSFR